MEDNGILEQVGGNYIAQAQLSLPPAVTAEDRDYPVEIDAGDAGMVRVIFRRQMTRRAKRSHWFWLARRADAV